MGNVNAENIMNLTFKRIIVIVVLLILVLFIFEIDAAAEVRELHAGDSDVATLQRVAVNQTDDTDSEEIEEEKSFVITHYTSKCYGCTGITASGYNVKNTIYYKDYRIVAAPKSIPLYTKMKITYQDGTKVNAIVLDRGGAIRANKLDLLVTNKKEAYRLGKQVVAVKIIN